MGIRLMVEVMEDAPSSLAWRELYVLLALAETANENTRRCWPAFDGDEERSKQFRKRCRCSRTQFYAVLKSLEAQGVIKTVVEACKGKQAVYEIPRMATVTPGPDAPVRKRRPQPKKRVPSNGTQSGGVAEGIENPSSEASESPLDDALSPVERDPTEANVSRPAEQCVPSSGTPTPHVPSTLYPLNAANAADVGWGVWGAGSGAHSSAPTHDAPGDAAFADAPAGHGFAAPDDVDVQTEAPNRSPQPAAAATQHLTDALAALDDSTYMDLRRHIRQAPARLSAAKEIAAMHARAVELGLIPRPADTREAAFSAGRLSHD